MLVSYSANLTNCIQDVIEPEFEARTNAKVNIIAADWGNRMDKILVLLAAGTPADVVVTGFYSPYEEGSMGMLAPLDGYLAKWQNTKRYAPPIWDAVKWQGEVMVLPNNLDFRGIAYNKDLFRQAGYDPNRPPQSWDEMLSYTKRLTRAEGDKVAIRGIWLGWNNGQTLFWFMRQAGIPEMNVRDFTSNLNREEALDALVQIQALYQAALVGTPLIGGGFLGGRTAMEQKAPELIRQLLRNASFDVLDNLGLLPPRRYPDSQPVGLGFVNGLAITQASRNKDLAWEFIALMNSDEHLMKIQEIEGWITGRADLARKMATSILPKADLWYDMTPYLQASVIPKPRNISLVEIGKLQDKVMKMELSPQAALEHGHDLWTRLLADWKAEIANL